ncbi:hypothetical protein ACVNBB_004799 [Escherichia coli]
MTILSLENPVILLLEKFRDEGFILAHGRECSLNGSGRNMLSRILHVGHSGLPKAEWGIDHSNHLLH